MNNSIARHFKALYGRKLSPEVVEIPKFTLPVDIGLRTVIRLILWMVLVCEFILIHCFGTFVIMKQEAYMAGSRLEIEYQRRENLLPRLLTITKAYSRHERELMNYVSDARALGKSAEKLKKILGPEKGAQVGKVFAKLIALAEQYPDLKADQSYKALMEKTVAAENRVAAAREEYNGRIFKYNLKLTTFPYVMFARPLKFEPMDIYNPEKEPVPAKNVRFYFVY
ncbi:MAG: LemA family protein [Elusimicrobia bacterium]|nr:LemA family protein [Elusimicrobiota bacterium]